jgi:hypothetical protein
MSQVCHGFVTARFANSLGFNDNVTVSRVRQGCRGEGATKSRTHVHRWLFISVPHETPDFIG